KTKLSALPDLTTLRQLTLHDDALFQSVLSQFLEETGQDVKTLKAAIENGDAKQVREAVHRLSGRLSQIGLTAQGSRLYEIESHLADGVAVDRLPVNLSALIVNLEEILDKLKLTRLEHLN